MNINLENIPIIIDEEKIKKLYNGDYKKALEDTAKSERNLAFKNSYLETKINKQKEVLDKIKEIMNEDDKADNIYMKLRDYLEEIE